MISCQKKERWRSNKYKDWVKSQACYYCRRTPVDPHHLIGIGHMSGGGLTAPDWTAMPLCRECHNKMHNTPLLWPEQWEIIARTLGKAIEDGFLIIKGEK